VGEFRTVYAGQCLLGCLLKVLAGFRPDLALQGALSAVEEDPADAAGHPTLPATRRCRRAGTDCPLWLSVAGPRWVGPGRRAHRQTTHTPTRDHRSQLRSPNRE